jgi:YidC/Oxa1 family membrane protein insertase
MDKNQAVGFVLMALLLMGYFYFFGNQQIQTPPQDAVDSVNNVVKTPDTVTAPQQSSIQQQMTEEEKNVPDSAEIASSKYGIFSEALVGDPEEIEIENDVVRLKYSTKGGLVTEVALKEFDDYQYEVPLILLDEESSKLKYLISTPYGNINLADLHFEAEETRDGDTLQLSFTADLGENKFIRHIYQLPPESYHLKHQFIISGLEDEISGNKVNMIWDNFLKRLETDIEYNRRYTTINYWTSSGSHENLSATADDKEEETFSEAVNWFAFKQRFFTNGYVFNKPVTNGYISSQFSENDTVVSKYCRVMLDLPLNHFTQEAGPNTYYYGPNRLRELKKVAPGFKENLEVGWPVIRWINQYAIIPIFTFLEKYISNYGIIIIILVFIIKIVLSPLTYKSHISMAKTKALKPELDELKEKYGGDMQKMQAEQMKLYQQVGVNPLSGCIPMLLQMPILFAMFQFIPHAIELRHESFLWATDLSRYDAIISWSFDIPLISSFYGNHVSLFTILMTVSTILYTWINSQSTAQMQGPMKSMQYFMPVIFMFVLNNFPAGLTFYYFVSNLVSFGQIAIIRKFVDDDKIRAILEENKKKNKNKKKSKFQARLEDAMKASEAAKKNKKKR